MNIQEKKRVKKQKIPNKKQEIRNYHDLTREQKIQLENMVSIEI